MRKTRLGCDRTVLLGGAIDHFHLPRSRLIAHAFLEEPGVAVKRAQIKGGPWRYAKYRLQMFLLAEDGFRQVKANLDFMTGTLTIRERTSYRYDATVSVRFLQEARRQTFELRLTAGEPITVRVRDADPSEAQQDQKAGPTEETQEAAEAEEDTVPDVSSVADLLHALEVIAGEGPTWFRDATSPEPGQATRPAVGKRTHEMETATICRGWSLFHPGKRGHREVAIARPGGGQAGACPGAAMPVVLSLLPCRVRRLSPALVIGDRRGRGF